MTLTQTSLTARLDDEMAAPLVGVWFMGDMLYTTRNLTFV